MHVHDQESDGIKLASALKWLEVVVQIVFRPAGQHINDLVLIEVIEDTDIITVFEVASGRIYLINTNGFRKCSSWYVTMFVKDPDYG